MHDWYSSHYLIACSWWYCMRGHRSRLRWATSVRCRYNHYFYGLLLLNIGQCLLVVREGISSLPDCIICAKASEYVTTVSYDTETSARSLSDRWNICLESFLPVGNKFVLSKVMQPLFSCLYALVIKVNTAGLAHDKSKRKRHTCSVPRTFPH